MFETGKREKAAKKAYEIAYAIFRISAKFDDNGIKEKIQSYATDLLVSAKTDEYGNAAKAVAAIDCLIKFAIDLNIVSIANGDVLLQEINNMNEAIAECLDKTDEEVDVSRFFSEKSCAIPATRSTERVFIPRANEEEREEGEEGQRGQRGQSLPSSEGRLGGVLSVSEGDNLHRSDEGLKVKIESSFSGRPGAAPRRSFSEGEEERGSRFQSSFVSEPKESNIIKSGMRQIAILDKIRQSGNCKLREIQEVLPDSSERTIRYDIEELIERNLIERIGAGGPAVSYRSKQSSVIPEEAGIQK